MAKTAKRKIKFMDESDRFIFSARTFKPRTQNQSAYINSMRANIITFGIGHAGTGKSYCAIAWACEELKAARVDKIIFTRPGVTCENEEYGFLKGDLDDKIMPFYLPVKDHLHERLGENETVCHIKNGNIEFRPLAFMRGSSFNDCIVIFDEAQNATVEQFKMFLTRIGENCRVIIDGDVTQSDIKGGLRDAILRTKEIEGVGVVEFTFDDVVRSGICKEILRAYL